MGGAKKVTSFKDEVEGKAGGKRKSTIAVLFNHIGDSLAGKESAQAGTTQTAEDPNMDKPPLRKKGAKKIASFKDEVEGKAGGKGRTWKREGDGEDLNTSRKKAGNSRVRPKSGPHNRLGKDEDEVNAVKERSTWKREGGGEGLNTSRKKAGNSRVRPKSVPDPRL